MRSDTSSAIGVAVDRSPIRIPTLLREMFDAAVASAQPARRIAEFLPKYVDGRLIVIGAGKASAAMAQAVERHWLGPLEGLVVTRDGYGVPCRAIEIVEASHPVPDARGLAAARRMIEKVSGLTPKDVVLCLISGGGSALLPLPASGITLEEKQQLNTALLNSGATIAEMNCVRRHLSTIKGGRLALACGPARVINLIISDVPADDASDVASGPTVPDVTTCADALAILRRYRIDVTPAIHALLHSGTSETPKPDDARLSDIETHFIATPQMALEAAAAVAEARGVRTHILGDAIEGEARDVGLVMAAIARQVAQRGQPFSPPCVLLSGGETTVTVKGDGRGGRNVEFLLSLGIGLNGAPDVYALAADTDGVDGREEIAGAVLYPDTLERARKQGLRPIDVLDENDAHSLFLTLDDSIVTGPTLTNVNDFRAIFIDATGPGRADAADRKD